MQSSKLVIMLKALHPAEMIRLEKFLDNPYFGEVKQKAKVLQLFDFLQQQHPKFDPEQLDKKAVFELIFPGMPFSATKMDKVMSRLLKMVRKFITTEYVRQDEIQQLLIELRFFRERELMKPFQQTINQLRKLQAQEKEKNQDFYFNNFLIEQEIAEFESFYNKRRENLNLPKTLGSLDFFYLIAWLRYTCRLLTQHTSGLPLDIQDQLILPAPLQAMIEKDTHLQIPLVVAYHQAYLLLYYGDESEIYIRLMNLLETHAAEIPFVDLQALQAICRNYCVRQYNRGNKSYLKESFRLYKTHLEAGYLYYKNGILPSAFKNIVTLGIESRQFDWVGKFLDSHRDKIVATDFPNDIYRFNLANYYFALQEYETALDHLADKYEDTYYKISARRLELKIYYEEKSILLDSKIEAFKVYLYRISKKLLTDLHRQGNNNFIDLLRQLNHPKTYKNLNRIQRLKARIDARKAIMDKRWLLEKLEEKK